MFTDDVFGFKKLEDGKWEVRTFSFYRMCRYSFKQKFFHRIIKGQYKQRLKIIHVVCNVAGLAFLAYCKTLYKHHNPIANTYFLTMCVLLFLYISITNFLTNYYVRKSN